MSNVRPVHPLRFKLPGLTSRQRNKRMYRTRVTYTCDLVLPRNLLQALSAEGEKVETA